jgi:hypothetical protein
MTVYDLKGYMGTRYVQVNNAIRSNQIRGGRTPGIGLGNTDLEESVLLIDKELDTLGRAALPGRVLYRRAGLVTEYPALVVGSVFQSAAYLSTSDNAVNYSWANKKKDERNVLFFTITTGALGGGRDVSHIRNNSAEAEVIFHRKSQFTVSAVETDKGNKHWRLTELVGVVVDGTTPGYIWGAHRT